MASVPDVAAKIFDRLYQVPGAPRASRNGLGLGLYICKELVVHQGGEISLESVPDNGSTFSFTVPIYTSGA